jgi:hypothetical protein
VTTARCPAEPECWAGLVIAAGEASAGQVPCTQPHYWQTFAIAILPTTAQTSDQPMVAADPTVKAVCALSVLMASRQSGARRLPGPAWTIEVLPPDEAAYDSGARAYRCLANEIGHTPSASQFGR